MTLPRLTKNFFPLPVTVALESNNSSIKSAGLGKCSKIKFITVSLVGNVYPKSAPLSISSLTQSRRPCNTATVIGVWPSLSTQLMQLFVFELARNKCRISVVPSCRAFWNMGAPSGLTSVCRSVSITFVLLVGIACQSEV